MLAAEIEAEQALVAANRELITRFEQKIQATLARIWSAEGNDWDRQIEQDAAAGKLDPLAAEARADYRAGQG